MHYPLVSALLIGLVAAQGPDVDLDQVLALDPSPSPSIPVVYLSSAGQTAALATTASYAPSSVIAAVSAAVNANATDIISLATTAPSLAKRTVVSRATTCVSQPTGYGPVPTPDTPSNFLNDPDFASMANNANTPIGYVRTFQNLQASNNAYGYMGYTILQSYDTQMCADKCTAIRGCSAFNLYFERDPSVDPNSSNCPNPPSTTQIKCVFWGGPVTASNAVNSGQWRNQFQVVIAGSNGYVNISTDIPPGYSASANYGNNAISAPLDCSGNSRVLKTTAIQAPAFDIELCAAACTAQAASASAQGSRACSFFNTYIQYKNGVSLGQMCVMYDATYPASDATNPGYYYGNDHYTFGFSYGSYNLTNNVQPYACPPALCNNAGLQWAYQADNQRLDTADKQATYDPTVIKSEAPTTGGTTPSVGLTQRSTTFYGSSSSISLSADYYALNHRGYLFAPETGTYTFNATSVDDVLSVWIGPNAYSGWTGANEAHEFAWSFVSSSYGPGSGTYTTTLTAGQFYPLRIIYKQSYGGASFALNITSPSGRQLLSGSTTASSYLIQYSCDGTSSPQYAPYGSEQ